jgi:hypothetical protein
MKSNAIAALSSRRYWLSVLEKLAAPVLEAAARRELRAAMPDRDNALAPLAATSRVLASIAPWLELENLKDEEAASQNRFRVLARAALESVLDPASPDYVGIKAGRQVLVETCKLSQAVLYARRTLWEKLDTHAQENFVSYLSQARAIKPGFNNWLLFAAANEAALCVLRRPWDRMRIDYALRQHEQWYLGDGIYSDGPEYHFDFYNSLVIHPLLVTIVQSVAAHDEAWAAMEAPIIKRARRHAHSLERLISPEGTFPPIGRSLGYRCGVFHGLAFMALLRKLPDGLPPSQVRSALTAVMQSTLEAPGTFDERGWLQIGFCGAQAGIAEDYMTLSSSYLCGFILLPLGLSFDDEFWAGPDLPWTAKRLWSSEEVKPDKAL